jgi:hypothetical protein
MTIHGSQALGSRWLGSLFLSRSKQQVDFAISGPAGPQTVAPERGGCGTRRDAQNSVLDGNTMFHRIRNLTWNEERKSAATETDMVIDDMCMCALPN